LNGLQRYNQRTKKEDKPDINNRIGGDRTSLIGSKIDIHFRDKEFDEIFSMFDEVFENESRSYNLIQANKQLTLFAECIEVRNIVSTVSKRFDGKIKKRTLEDHYHPSISKYFCFCS
jgi:hypothetical protein